MSTRPGDGSRESSASSPEVLVLGMGNVLMEDDAFGPRVVRMLETAYDLPAGVSVLDVGAPGLSLTPYVRDVKVLIAVDTVEEAGPSGRIHRYTEEELLAEAPATRLGPHDPGLKDTLFTLKLDDRAPEEVVLLGVTTERTGSGLGLSAPVEKAVPWAVAAVLQELRRLGRPARPRPDPEEPEVWWEQPPGA